MYLWVINWPRGVQNVYKLLWLLVPAVLVSNWPYTHIPIGAMGGVFVFYMALGYSAGAMIRVDTRIAGFNRPKCRQKRACCIFLYILPLPPVRMAVTHHTM